MFPSSSRRGAIATAAIVTTATLSLLIAVLTTFATVRWVQLRDAGAFDDFEITPPTSGSSSPSPSTDRCSDEPCNFLLLGSDSREGLGHDRFGTNEGIGGTARADTIMLAHTDPARRTAVVLSFPRDLWVRIPGHGFDRINTAFEGGPRHGGPQLMARTVADLTGLTIHHYLYVDLDGFQDVVETIGGVEMCIPAYNVNTPGWLPATTPDGQPTQVYVPDEGRIADPNAALNIAPGCQRLDGEQALAYVRARHLPCDHIPDFSRIGRQQQFLRSVVNQLLQPSRIVQAPSLVPDVLRQLRRDRGFLPSDLVYLVGQLRGLDTGAVEFRAVPSVAATVGAKAVLRLDPSARELFAALRRGRPLGTVGSQLGNTPPSEANVRVAVVDARSRGNARRIEGLLADSGFDISPGILELADGPRVPGPAIVFTDGAEAHARVVAAYLGELPLVGPRQLDGADVAVVVPASYRPPPPEALEETGCPTPA